MKKLFATISTIAASAASLLAGTTAVIDMDKVVSKFPETPAVLENLQGDVKILQEQEKTFNEQLRAKQATLQGMIKEMNSPMLSEKAKAAKREEAAALDQEILKEGKEMQNALTQMQKSFEEKRNSELNKIFQKIVPYIQNYMKEKGIGVLINLGTRSVVYAEPEHDITDAIVEILEKEFPAKKDENSSNVPAPTLQ